MIFSSLFSQNIQIISSILIMVMFLLIFFLLWLNRKIFFDLFRNINRIVVVILLLLIITFSLICVFEGFNFRSFIPSDQEWEILKQAKGLATGDQIFHQLRYGLVYPLFLSFGFKIFGFNPLVASIANLILSILSILLVFILSQAIFKNSKISLLSTFIYAFTPLIFAFSSLQMGFPAIINFFLLFFTLVSVLYFQHHKISLLALSLISIILISQIKPEYLILIIPFVLCFFFFKEYKHISIKKLLILIILFFIFSAPYFVKNAQFIERYNSGWCGYPSLLFYNGEKHSYHLPIVNQLDKALKSFTNNRFSMNYLIYSLPNFAKFWTFQSFLFISFLILIGIIFGFRKHPREYLCILIPFSSISFLYLSDCALLDTRYLMPTYGLVVVLAGFGLNFVAEKIAQLTKQGHLFQNILLIFFVLFISLYWYYYDYQPYLFKESYLDYTSNQVSIINDYDRLKNIIQDISNEHSNFIVVHPNEERILQFLGYQATSLVNCLNVDIFVRINQSETVNQSLDFKKAIKLPLDFEKDNYFIQSWYCETLEQTRESCNFVTNRYTLKLKKQTANNKLYLFVR